MDSNDWQHDQAGNAPAHTVPVVVFIGMTRCDSPRRLDKVPVLPDVNEQAVAMDRGPGISYC